MHDCCEPIDASPIAEIGALRHQRGVGAGAEIVPGHAEASHHSACRDGVTGGWMIPEVSMGGWPGSWEDRQNDGLGK